jgi:hypothetical protein
MSPKKVMPGVHWWPASYTPIVRQHITNLAIDDKLIENARRIGNHKTKKAVVTEALIEYIQRREQLKILGLFGTIDYDDDYNYKDQRKRN